MKVSRISALAICAIILAQYNSISSAQTVFFHGEHLGRSKPFTIPAGTKLWRVNWICGGLTHPSFILENADNDGWVTNFDGERKGEKLLTQEGNFRLNVTSDSEGCQVTASSTH